MFSSRPSRAQSRRAVGLQLMGRAGTSDRSKDVKRIKELIKADLKARTEFDSDNLRFAKFFLQHLKSMSSRVIGFEQTNDMNVIPGAP
jgi:hypothetical protein